MSTVMPYRSPAPPETAARLLLGLSADTTDASLQTHLERWGALPRRGPELVNELDASGLAGHGGAWFPVAAKWRSVAAASRRRPVVVANGAEGEPASRKDALLLTRAPHLVLDGLSLASETMRAHRAIAYVPAHLRPTVDHAVAERRRRRTDAVEIEIVECPHTFLAGQETAVVSQIGGSRHGALPTFQGLTPVRERGVGGRPTLIHNAETLAQVALVGRFGAAWFRSVGATDAPGTMLMTVTRATGTFVVEAALGSSLRQATRVTDEELATVQGVLLGGYGGGWVSTRDFGQLPVSEKAVRRAGSTLGAGVVALLPGHVCPLAEMAAVVRYMERQGAGQCGPCIHGLADLASSMEALTLGGPGSARPERLAEVCHLVEGRGACRHPDGVARFVRTGLQVFADEVIAHQHNGGCARVHAPRVLPGTGAGGTPRSTRPAGATPTRRLVRGS